MGADSNNMLAALQMQLAQQSNQGPNLYGLTAQQDPNVTAGLLSNLQQQNYVNSVGNANSDDLVSLFANAGKKDAARLGQNIAGLAGIGQPQQYSNAANIQQRQAIQAGNAGVTQDLANGVDPIQAKINALQKAAQAGLPGAAQALDGAMDQQQKAAQSKAQVFKDTAQGVDSADQPSSRAATLAEKQAVDAQNTSKDSWQTIAQENGYITQKNGLGEVRTQKNSDTSSSAIAQLTPNAMQSMLDYYHTNNKVPPGIARSPAVAGKFWDAEAQYQAQTGNTAAATMATAAAQKANTDALTATQKQLSATSSYLDTMDKNVALARQAGNALNFKDVGTFNKALQAWDKGTSDPQFAKYNLFFNSVANESAKIQSGSLGNVTVSDTMRHEIAQTLPTTIGNGGMNAVFDALQQEGQNRVQSLAAQRDDLIGRIAKKTGTPGQSPAPGLPQPPIAVGAPPAQSPQAAPVAPTLNYDPKTGTFH